MEPSAPPPWRVIEMAPDRTAGAAGTTPAAGVPHWLGVVGIGVVAIVCVIGAFALASGGGNGTVRVDGGVPLPIDGSPGTAGPSGGTGGELVVEITGAVPNPGVYRVPAGSRVGDLLRLAGGYGPRVDTARAGQELNLAARVEDGDRVRVPSRDDHPTASTREGTDDGPAPTGGLIDLNTASQAELEELPGIGPATAGKIIAAREETPFATVDELRSRGVLGEKTFEKVRPLVTAG